MAIVYLFIQIKKHTDQTALRAHILVKRVKRVPRGPRESM